MNLKIPEEWYEKPPNTEDIPEGIFIIQTDAAFKDGITSTAVIIKTKGNEYNPQTNSARNEGPIHAELTSIKHGLQRIKRIKKYIRLILVYNDNLYAYYFLSGVWTAQKDYIKKALNDIQNIIYKLETRVEFIWVKSKYNKRVDRLALKRRKQEEKKKEQQIQERVMKVEEAIVRGRKYQIYEEDGNYFAIPKKGGFTPDYKVSLNPPSCECPWWQNNWGNKEEYIQKARALPCKHMCALAEYLRVDIFEIFAKQIWRID